MEDIRHKLPREDKVIFRVRGEDNHMVVAELVMVIDMLIVAALNHPTFNL